MSVPSTISSSAARMRSSDLEIVFVDLDTSSPLLEAEEARLPRLGAADLIRSGRLADDRRRQSLWRATRIATRIVLERAAGPGLRRVDFEIAATGRPSLAAGYPHFNVSHTGSVALIAVSPLVSPGVDIEQRRPLSMSEDRRGRIVKAASALGEASPFDPASDADVLRAWVRLEAVAKARGTGIGVLLTDAGVIGGAERKDAAQTPSPMAVAELDVGADYVAAVAAGMLPENIDVTAFPTRTDALGAFMSDVGL